MPVGTMSNQLAVRLHTPARGRGAAGGRVPHLRQGGGGRRRLERRHVQPAARPAGRLHRRRPVQARVADEQEGVSHHAPPAWSASRTPTTSAAEASGRWRRWRTCPRPAVSTGWPYTWTGPGSGTRRPPAACRSREYARHCDTVSVCFPRGWRRPVGSASLGRPTSSPAAAGSQAVRRRHAAGRHHSSGALFALRHHRQRLTEDHVNAKRLADGLVGMGPNWSAGRSRRTSSASAARAAMRGRRVGILERGVAIMVTGTDTFRAVTHLMITSEDVTARAGSIRGSALSAACAVK